MATEVTVALISVAGSLIVGCLTLLGVLIQNRRHSKEITSVVEYRIKELEKKQDKHNQLIERVYALETAEKVVEERVNQLEEDVHGR